MNRFLIMERESFCNKFPDQLALAEKIWEASWTGKHWGWYGAIELSRTMCDDRRGMEQQVQVLSSYCVAFGHAAKQVLFGKVWYIFRAISAFGNMLDKASILQRHHESKPLELSHLQVLIAVYNRGGEVFKKIGWTDKSDDYFAKAYHLADSYLSRIELSTNESSKILLYADMFSNPLLDINERQRLTKACNWYVNVQGTSVTIKVLCLRALGKNEYATLMAKELCLDDQVLKST